MTKYICDICGAEFDDQIEMGVMKAQHTRESALSHVMEHSQIVFREYMEKDEIHFDMEFFSVYGLPRLSELAERKRQQDDADIPEEEEACC
jgi:hypothetical protein